MKVGGGGAQSRDWAGFFTKKGRAGKRRRALGQRTGKCSSSKK